MNNININNTIASKAAYQKPQIVELNHQLTQGGTMGVLEGTAMVNQMRKATAGPAGS